MVPDCRGIPDSVRLCVDNEGIMVDDGWEWNGAPVVLKYTS